MLPYPTADAQGQLDRELTEILCYLRKRVKSQLVTKLSQFLKRWEGEGKLLQADWEKHWDEKGQIFNGWFGRPTRDAGDKALLDAFTEMVRFVRDGKTAFRQKKYAGQLREAIESYLDRRGLALEEPVKDKQTEARNKWVYKQCIKRTPHDNIVAQLKQIAPEKGWRLFSSKQRAHQIGREYAESHNLPPPAPRQNL